MSAPTHPSKSAAQKPKTTRSRNGCWTCRSRKKKCDETRPECTQCLSKGLKCEGYEARLKWGNGVASRGYLKGMNCPIMVMGPGDVENRNGPQRKGGGGVFRESHGSSDSEVSAEVGKGSGDARNEGGEGGGDGLAQSATTAGAAAALLGAFDRELFREFREWGSECLSIASESGYSPFEDILYHCDNSESLVANCLMFQLSLHPEYEERQEAYYAEALRLFRRDVCDRAAMSKDATLIAGILLCSMGMQSCKSWTMHLNGLYSILRHRKTIQNQTPVASELIATIGFLDLPSHIVGRQTPTLNIWRDYCRGRSGTEPASGMPYNLLDIFSLIAEPDAEWHFWSWNTKDLDTTSVNYMLWDVTRLAGIIVAREYRRCSSGHIGPCDHASGGMFSSPSTEELVERIFSQLERLYQLSADVVRSTVNLLLFPAFTVGAQHSILSLKQKAFLEDFWTVFFFEDDTGSPHLQMPLKILRELWVNPCRRSADQIAQDWEVEVGLF